MLFAVGLFVLAQMTMPMPSPAASATPAAAATMPGMAGMTMSGAGMRGSIDLRVPMSQEGSGTSWLPAAGDLDGTMHGDPAGAMTMIHYTAFPRYVETGSLRGGERFDMPNDVMIMGDRPHGASQFGYAAMFSLDTLTENQEGYPLLYQSGETGFGQPLHDRQHPHDLVSELALDESYRLGSGASAYVYVADPGEPALGPPAYMHRPVGEDMPSAPLGHHWEDSTHVSFGVATLGVGSGRFKLEASLFNGREPDEVRTNFDRPRFDSRSARLSWNPDPHVAVEVSQGDLRSPEALTPAVNLRRTAGSVFVAEPFAHDREFSYGVVYGRNDAYGPGAPPGSSAYLFEGEYRAGHETLYTRLERVQKSGDDLVLDAPALASTLFDVGQYAFGYVHDLAERPGAARIGVGTQVTFGHAPQSLDPFYGENAPVSFEVFLRIRSPRMPAMEGTR